MLSVEEQELLIQQAAGTHDNDSLIPDDDERTPSQESDDEEDNVPRDSKPFRWPARSRWMRIVLPLFFVILAWVFAGKPMVFKKHEVIYASRYSKEHKYRPAASPIITETLKDGRIRIRGANPTSTSTASSTATKRPKPKSGKVGGQRRSLNRKKGKPKKKSVGRDR